VRKKDEEIQGLKCTLKEMKGTAEKVQGKDEEIAVLKRQLEEFPPADDNLRIYL
jgi:hypothetical protein